MLPFDEQHLSPGYLLSLRAEHSLHKARVFALRNVAAWRGDEDVNVFCDVAACNGRAMR